MVSTYHSYCLLVSWSYLKAHLCRKSLRENGNLQNHLLSEVVVRDLQVSHELPHYRFGVGRIAH